MRFGRSENGSPQTAGRQIPPAERAWPALSATQQFSETGIPHGWSRCHATSLKVEAIEHWSFATTQVRFTELCVKLGGHSW
jgi:hypothetical protein